MRHLLTRLAAAALVAAAALAAPVVPAPAAQAAACGSDSGVTVVVDYGSLGGGIGQTCVAGGGGDKASTIFPDAGYALTYVQTQPGFVCRVAGAPASEACQNTPPGGRFWGLWVSSGDGSWTFASRGVSSLTVPDGGSVAFAWDDVDGARRPGVAPAVHDDPSPSSSPTRQPSSQPTKQPGKQPTNRPTGPEKQPTGEPSTSPSASAGSDATAGRPTSSPSASGVATARPGKRKSPKAGRTRTTSPTAVPSGSPSASDEPVLSPAAEQPADAEDDGLPAWLALVALLLVAGGTGAVLVRRRRSDPGP